MTKELAPYAGHEWRAAMDGPKASSTEVVCAECGIRSRIDEVPTLPCRVRLAPKNWQPQS